MDRIVTAPRPSHRSDAPTRNRSGTSLRGSTRTSPRTPCGDRMTPTTRPWPSPSAPGSVDLEVDLGPVTGGHHLEERADGLRDAAASADDLADIGFRDLEVQLQEVPVLLFLHDDAARIVDERSRDVIEKL